MFIKNWKKEIFTIPNFLSLFRFCLIPVYLYVYLHATSAKAYIIAGTILAVSCLTDMIDGKIARHFHMISTVGKVLDPLADKATQFAMTLCLSLNHPVLQPVLLLFIVKELFQLIAGILALRKGQMLPGALFAGKLCTTVLFVSMILMVLFPELPSAIINGMAILDAGFLAISFVSYVLAYYGKNKKVENIPSE